MPPEALKLLERMRRSKSGWKRTDLNNLYGGFGFEIRHGASHDIVTHPDYPQLRETLPRHKDIKKYLVERAVKLIDRFIELQEAEQGKTDDKGREHEDDA